MLINLLKAKIHQATVTEANLYYIGSITIDKHILQQVGLRANELVHVVNINNGARIETYIIEGDSRVVCLNGAAARHFQPGDQIIIMAYCWLDASEAKQHHPQIAFLDEDNNICCLRSAEAAHTKFIHNQLIQE